MAGEAFEFSPLGMVPLGEGQRVWAEISGGGVDTPKPTSAIVAAPVAASHPTVPAALASVEPRVMAHNAAHAATGPRAVVKAARARAKEIRAELRRMKALQRELAELERLLAAASNKSPRATVRALETARRTG